ncbi:MAG TPA: hypothetical protein VGO43_12615 [Pyrinomonadaceae bacterium]|jgi:hypothetical protein|nr:hypothetical protein [Pyrinomonadaceae bacterium]
MVTIKNNLNQPLTLGERSLAAGGTMRVKSIDEDAARLAASGHITIIEDEPEKTDGGKKGEAK